MASSRNQVTITLGRSGQVVKRRAISDIANDDEVPVSGRKRSVRERLGNNVVDSDSYGSEQRNKRRQTESNSSQHGDGGLDCQVDRGDLRLKLMRKGLSQSSNGGAEQNGMDLREKLSRNSKNLQRYDTTVHVPESRSTRYDVIDKVPESRSKYDEKEKVPESRSRYDERDKVPESRSRYGLRGGVPESRASTLVSRRPSARSADDFLDSSRKPYPQWTADCSRRRSPDKLTSVWRDVSPPRTFDHMMPIPSLRSGGAARASSLITRDAPDTLRTHQPYNGKSTISIDKAQPANGITPSGTVLPTATMMTEVPTTVTGLLNSLGLEKYVFLFQAEEVDMAALRQMGDSDLKDMGVPMGPRKKILLAVAPYSKQRQR